LKRLGERQEASSSRQVKELQPKDLESQSTNVLLNQMKTRIQNMLTPIHQHLAAVSQQVLFKTPAYISTTFPTVKVSLTDFRGHSFEVEALLDSGATSTYISAAFVADHGIPIRPLSSPMYAYNADDTLNATKITHEAKFTVKIQGHTSTEWYFVTDIGSKSMIIGMTWLRSHNPLINWRSGKLEFTRCPYTCHQNLLPKDRLDFLLDEASVTTEYPSSEKIFSMKQEINAKTNPSTFFAVENLKTRKVLSIDDIKAGPFSEFADVFEEANYQDLPPHRVWDHKIDLVPEWEQRKWKPRIYPLTYDEQKELDAFLEENLANGRIRPSESPLASPVFFINKKDGKKRMVIDYRKLNDITVKNAYPVPLMDELIQKWKGCKFFSAVDVRSGYHNIRMKEGDEWKTAFITNRGLYESLVMTFGLTNAPAAFQAMMDSIFVTYIRRGDANPFFDDVGIGTTSDPRGILSDEDFHIAVCKEILQVFRENKLFLKPEKCLFLKKEIPYLGHIISGEGLRPDPAKLAGVRDWPVPSNVSKLRSFLGFLNYYRRFIPSFSNMAKPLNELLRKAAKWVWGEEQQDAFAKLKKTLLEDVVLSHPSQEQPFLLETDASKYAWGAVLSQLQEDGKWRPVSCLSKGFTEVEKRYDVHDRELLAIIRALESLRHFLMGSKHPITILSDHKNLAYFRTKQFLTDRQVRWADYLSKFDINLRYRPGKQSSVPDLLSRRADHIPEEDIPEPPVTLLPPSLFHSTKKASSPSSSPEAICSTKTTDFHSLLFTAQSKDDRIKEFNLLRESEAVPIGWSKVDNLWCYRGKIYIPKSLRVTLFKMLHEDPSAAHPGRQATLFSMRANYYWPLMYQDIERWIQECDLCQRVKIFPRKPHGDLKPIDPTPRLWGVVTSDLITGLPPCQGYDAIWTATDKRGKMIHVAPCTATLDSEGLYRLYLQHVWRLHGTSDKLITDRGPQFASKHAREINRNMQIETALSTAYHPQTDGQSERTNQEVETALRMVVNYHQDDWVDWIPVIEFALNNRYKRSLGTTPFYANYGFHPRLGSLPQVESPVTSVEDFVKHIQQVQKDTKASLEQAAEDMKRFYDRHRGPTPEFSVGQKVLLDNTDLSLNQPTRKLSERRSGPFEIVEKIGTHAYKLRLPQQWKGVHPVFHVSKIYPYREDPERPNFPAPPPDIVEGESEWEVERVLDARVRNRKLQFFVKWMGWPESENSWEPEQNLEHAKDLIGDFYHLHPTAPRKQTDGTLIGSPVIGRTQRKTRKKTSIRQLISKVWSGESRSKPLAGTSRPRKGVLSWL
jgi:hypothetical protein